MTPRDMVLAAGDLKLAAALQSLDELREFERAGIAARRFAREVEHVFAYALNLIDYNHPKGASLLTFGCATWPPSFGAFMRAMLERIASSLDLTYADLSDGYEQIDRERRAECRAHLAWLTGQDEGLDLGERPLQALPSSLEAPRVPDRDRVERHRAQLLTEGQGVAFLLRDQGGEGHQEPIRAQAFTVQHLEFLGQVNGAAAKVTDQSVLTGKAVLHGLQDQGQGFAHPVCSMIWVCSTPMEARVGGGSVRNAPAEGVQS
jgi:hypothetical protein